MTEPPQPLPQLAQLALCSGDLPRTRRLYADVFGFEDARGGANAGPRFAAVQGPESQVKDWSYILWWLTGRQYLVQFELFQYIDPRQEPLPDDWRVCDIGWGRFGIRVTDFDGVLARLVEFGASPLTDPLEIGGRRRVAFREPYTKLVVEVIEGESPAADDPEGHLPDIVNISCTVSDLDLARKFWIDDMGLPENRNFAFDPLRDHLWGLDGAEVSGFAVRLNDIDIEVMAYRPVGRDLGPRQLCDHGVTNVGLLWRDRACVEQMVERLQECGHDVPAFKRPGPVSSVYMFAPENIGVELFSVPEALDERVGFVPRRDGGPLGYPVSRKPVE